MLRGLVKPRVVIAAATGVACGSKALADSWAEDLKAKQEHVSHSALDGKTVHVDIDQGMKNSLPVIPLTQIKEDHVTYQGLVYDISEFADAHPGGKELLLTASGLDLGHFFKNYTVHANNDKAAQWLEGMVVGKLSEEDSKRAQEKTTPSVHATRRMSRLRAARRELLGVVCALPACIATRALIRFVGRFLSKTVAHWLARRIPFAIPGYTPGSEPLAKGTVAVVGGGIAGCGAAWMLEKDGFDVTLFEARPYLAGNARTFDWDGFADGVSRKSCVSVTAWPPLLYKNYEALLAQLQVETTPMPLSWFLVSKVPGYEGALWGADARPSETNTLREVFKRDFAKYKRAEDLIGTVTAWFTGRSWYRKRDEPSMYDSHTGLGMLNPFNVVPLYRVCKLFGVSDEWWDIIFTPYYTASFLVDELRPFPAVFGPIIEHQIPLLPNKSNSWQGDDDCHLTTCVTWKDAGDGIRSVFEKLTARVDVRLDTRVAAVHVLPNGKKRVIDDRDGCVDVDRVIFACPCTSASTILKRQSRVDRIVLASPEYADDHHPDSGHMHAVMHSDASVIDARYRDTVLKRASNYVEVTRLDDASYNYENQYNFGVQTPGHGVYAMDLKDKPVMLISHALGPGKSIDKATIRGGGNHARAHPLYSPYNVASQLALRLCQGKDGVYFCSNWTTPGNCHDMSLLSGFLCAHAIGATYPFPDNAQAHKDFHRLNDLMGVF